MRRWLALALVLGACAAPPTPPLPQWTDTDAGYQIILAHTPQIAPPAVWVGDQAGAAAWVGSDAAGVHIDTRTFTPANGSMSPAVVLPLPPHRPTALTLHSTGAQNGESRLRLLWLDADEDGETALYTALLGGVDNGALRVERGPVQASDQAVLDYAAAADRFGTLWAVWRGGAESEPRLYLQRIDAAARPALPTPVAEAVGAFALVPDAAGLLLFWEDKRAHRLMLTRLLDGTAAETRPLTNLPALRPTDRLLSLRAGQHNGEAAVFWQIERWQNRTAQPETWWASGALDAPSWTPPAPLMPAAPYAVPISGAHDAPLEIAVGGAQVAIQPFGAGALAPAMQMLPAPHTLSAPLALRHDGALYLAWSQPTTPDAASLILRRTPQAF